MKKNVIILFLILFSIIFLNLSILLFLQVSPLNPYCDIDSKAYLEKAMLLYKTHSFAPTPLQQQFPYYTLGYSAFITLVYKIFSPSIEWIILIQVLLTLLSAFLIFLITTRLFNPTVGIISFALTCTNIGFLTFSQFILTECLLTFFLILFFERFTAYLSNKDPLPLIHSALALGFSVVIKPAALYYPILLLPIIFFTATQAKKYSFTLLFFLTFTLPIFGYMLHNKIVFNQFKIANIDSVNLYFWFYPNVLAEMYNLDSNVERAKLTLIAGPNNINLPVIKEMFKSDFRKNPTLFIYVWLKNVIKTFLGLFSTNLKVLVEPHIKGGDISFFKMKGTLVQRAWLYIQAGTTKNWLSLIGFLEAIWTIIRYLLCIIALLTLIHNHQNTLLYLFISYIFYFSIITGHDGCARFRMMFEFVLIILAAFGLWILFRYKEVKEKNERCLFYNSCRW